MWAARTWAPALLALIIFTGVNGQVGESRHQGLMAPKETKGKYGDLCDELKGAPTLAEIKDIVGRAKVAFAKVATALRSSQQTKTVKPYRLGDRIWEEWLKNHGRLIEDLQRVLLQERAFLIDYAAEDPGYWDPHHPTDAFETDELGMFTLFRVTDRFYFIDHRFAEMEAAGPDIADTSTYSVAYVPKTREVERLHYVLVSARVSAGSGRPYPVILRMGFLVDEPAVKELQTAEEAKGLIRELYPEMQELLQIPAPPGQ